MVGIVAGVELVLLVVAGISLIAKPVQHSVKQAAVDQAHAAAAGRGAAHAATRSVAARTRKVAAAPAAASAAVPKRTRAKTGLLVLNGIGTSGAAARTAVRLQSKGYRIDAVTNAPRTGYTRTLIMYRPGFQAEAVRLGHDMKVPLVGPLDGMQPKDLGRAQLVVIVGG